MKINRFNKLCLGVITTFSDDNSNRLKLLFFLSKICFFLLQFTLVSYQKVVSVADHVNAVVQRNFIGQADLAQSLSSIGSSIPTTKNSIFRIATPSFVVEVIKIYVVIIVYK